MSTTTFAQWRPHPWHGLDAGRETPIFVNSYIEITPFDLIKYELDKATGYLRVDRPQRTSSQPPALYGFIPRTYCAERIAALCPGADHGDGDPLDICVLSERAIARSEVIIPARVVGGIQLLDRGEADDKILAVLEGDFMWSEASDLADLPEILVERLEDGLGPPGVERNCSTPLFLFAPPANILELLLELGRPHEEVLREDPVPAIAPVAGLRVIKTFQFNKLGVSHRCRESQDKVV